MKIHTKIALVGLGLLVSVVGGSSLVHAHGAATGVVKERMDLMQDMADAMKVMGAMFKGEAALEEALVAEKASFLAKYARSIPEMTPEGSDGHPSETLPVVWQAWDAYVDGAVQLADEGTRLVDIAREGADETALRAQYVAVSKTCGTCHDRFRKAKN